jgi:hypothetical protein
MPRHTPETVKAYAAVAPATGDASGSAGRGSGEQRCVQSQKITISLFPADCAKLLVFQQALAKRGRIVSVSHALRLAVRSLPVTDAGAMTEEVSEGYSAMLDAMSEEDGRSKRFSWGPASKVVSEQDKTGGEKPKTGRPLEVKMKTV